MAPNESKTEKLIRENQRLKDDVKRLKSARLASNVTPVAKDFVRFGFIAFGSWAFAHEIAGKKTDFNAVAVVDAGYNKQNASAHSENSSVSVIGLAFNIFSVVALGIAIWQNRRYRRLNKDQVRQLADVTEKYERLINPNRTSSRLGSDGQTHEEDRI